MIFWISALAIGAAVGRSSLNACAGEQCREEGAPVIAAPLCIGFGGPPHFTDGNDQCVVQEASVIEVSQQGSACLIERGKEMLLHIVAVAVRVPAVTVHAIVVHCDESGPCFDESPGHQAGLAEEMPSISVSQLCRFLLKIKCASGFVGGDQCQCTPSNRILLVRLGGFKLLSALLKLVQQRDACLERLQRNLRG